MIRYHAFLSALVPLLLATALVACTVRVKGTADGPATPVRRDGHVTEPAPGARHGQVSQAPGAPHGHVSQAPDACAVHSGTGCYWMENESGRYCWVPAEWADTYDGCYTMDSCDGGKGESNGGCYKWADSSHAQRTRWPNQ